MEKMLIMDRKTGRNIRFVHKLFTNCLQFCLMEFIYERYNKVITKRKVEIL